MRATIAVLAGVLVSFSWAVAQAQEAWDGPPLTWTPVPNCRKANELGPRAYADVANHSADARQEMDLLGSVLQACRNGAQQLADAEHSDVIPDGGPADFSGLSRPSSPSNASPGTTALQLLQTLGQRLSGPSYAAPPSTPSYSSSAPAPSYTQSTGNLLFSSSSTGGSAAASVIRRPAEVYVRPSYAYPRAIYAPYRIRRAAAAIRRRLR